MALSVYINILHLRNDLGTLLQESQERDYGQNAIHSVIRYSRWLYSSNYEIGQDLLFGNGVW